MAGMSEERLKTIRESREFGLRTVTSVYLREAIDEIAQQRTKIERLQEAGRAALEYMDECECYWPDGSPDQGFVPIKRPCPHRMMENALSPEPAS